MNKNKLSIVIVGIAIVAASFYGGMQYGSQKLGVKRMTINFQNLSPEERQIRMDQMGNAGFAGRGGKAMGLNGGLAISGEILNKDNESITLKLRDGGSKIIFISGTTNITKNVTGSATDLITGEQVVVMGSTNQDGSVNSQSIQIRPKAQ